MSDKSLNFVFFGTNKFSTIVLESLKTAGFTPRIIVCAPDKPSGRGQHIQKPESKIWGEENSISILQPEKLNADFVDEIKKTDWDFFVVASYGKIIPQSVIDLPKFGSLNVHPSLLPKFRGASPIESAILADEKETGVTIMLVDKEMDHGPILNKEIVKFGEWPTKIKVENKLAEIGGNLLSKTISEFINGEIKPEEQNHNDATFTKKIAKEDGEINLSTNWKDELKEEQYKNFLKIQALNPWPGAYFFIKHGDKKIRVKITTAKFMDDKLEIEKVIPEGRKEMSYNDFEKGFLKN
jgi:methionyl-tRNA formyltransferase